MQFTGHSYLCFFFFFPCQRCYCSRNNTQLRWSQNRSCARRYMMSQVKMKTQIIIICLTFSPRTQIAVYSEKFEQFQETLTRSNEVFSSFKKDMEKVSKMTFSLSLSLFFFLRNMFLFILIGFIIFLHIHFNNLQLTKANKKLEQENNTWRSRWEKTNNTLIDMLEERNEQAKVQCKGCGFFFFFSFFLSPRKEKDLGKLILFFFFFFFFFFVITSPKTKI